jgi:hypothetical protein
MHSCTDVQAGPRFGMMGHLSMRMTTGFKFGMVALAGAALLLAGAGPSWGQRGGHAGGGMGGGRVGGGARGSVSHGPMMSSAPRSAPRMAPSRMTSASLASRPMSSRPVTSRSIASRPRTAAVARVAGVSANRRTVTSFRNVRDRFGRLHRVRVVSFVGLGYPGYLDYYPYDYSGFDQNSYDSNQNSYDAAPQVAAAPADQSAPASNSYAAAAPNASVPDAGGLILVRKDGQIVTPNAFAISGDNIVYVTRQGARLSFPVAELDKDTTRKMNEANGTNVAIPD